MAPRKYPEAVAHRPGGTESPVSTNTEAVQTFSRLKVTVSQDVRPKIKSGRVKLPPTPGFTDKALEHMGPLVPQEKPPDLCNMLNKACSRAESLPSHMAFLDLALLDLAQQQKASFATVFGEVISQEVQKQMGQVFQEFECLPHWRANIDVEYEEWLAWAAAQATPTPADLVRGQTVQWVRDQEDLTEG